jgi:hypothetical protein
LGAHELKLLNSCFTGTLARHHIATAYLAYRILYESETDLISFEKLMSWLMLSKVTEPTCCSVSALFFPPG